MPDEGFGSGLWKNIQAVQFGREGEMLAPVRADGSEGIVVGVDAVGGAGGGAPPHPGDRAGAAPRLGAPGVAAADAAASPDRADEPGPLRRLVARLRR